MTEFTHKKLFVDHGIINIYKEMLVKYEENKELCCAVLESVGEFTLLNGNSAIVLDTV